MGFGAALVILLVGSASLAGWISLFPAELNWGITAGLFGAAGSAVFFWRRPRLGLPGQFMAAFVYQAVVFFAVGTAKALTDFSGYNWYSIVLWGFILAIQILFSLAILVRIAEMTDLAGKRRMIPITQSPLPSADVASFHPMVSIHLACCREPPEVVMASLDYLARLNYPNFEVLVVDNNTPDPSLWEPVERHCRKLGPRFRFFSLGVWPGYKAGALNYALRHTHAEARLIGIVDADWQVDPEWLNLTVPYFADPKVGSVQGAQSFREGQSSFFKKIEDDECSGPYRISLVQRNEDNAAPLLGAMALLDRSTVEEVGGWAENVLSEDVELGLRILNHGRRAIYIDGKFHGQGLLPGDYQAYVRQRQRWCYGAINVLKLHWGMLTGRTGTLTRAQRYHFLKDWLRLVGYGLYPVFTMAAIGGTLLLLQSPALRQFPPPTFLMTALLLAAVDFGNLFWSYSSRLHLGARRVFFVVAAQLSLLHSVSKAIDWALLNRPLVFNRTERYGSRVNFFKSMAEVYDQILLAGVLLGLAVASTLVFGMAGLRGPLFSASLVVVALPYLAAIAMNAISYRSNQSLRSAPAPSAVVSLE